MITITIDTHLDITPTDLRMIADRLELWYTNWTIPYYYDIVHENYPAIIETLEETIDDLNDTIESRNDTIDDLKSDIDNLEATIQDKNKEIAKLRETDISF